MTAKLSKRFYDALGEDVANELVEWFNSVDATYKADLRDLIEVQAQRFDARLEQRIGVLEARIDQRLAEQKTELLKWLFLFWVGTSGLSLFGILSR